MKFSYLTYLLSILLLMACSTSTQKEERSSEAASDLSVLKEEVLAIHDEVMPKMGDLRRARKNLLLQADSLMESDPDRAAMLTTIADELDAANGGMMVWMRGYEPDYDSTETATWAYFESQKVSVQRVKEDMLNSLAKAKQAMGQ